MAHHDSTPASVLNAPTITTELVSVQDGFNRQERRHGIAKHEPEDYARRVAAGKNVPYRKPVAADEPGDH